MKSFILTILSFHNFGHAEVLNVNGLNDPITTLTQINNGSLLTIPAIDCNPHSELIMKNNKALFNQCAVDLCGPADKNVSHFITDDKFYKSANLWNKFKVNLKEPLLRDLLLKSKNYKLSELDALKKFLKNPSFNNLQTQEF